MNAAWTGNQSGLRVEDLKRYHQSINPLLGRKTLMTCVLTVYLNEFASTDLRDVVVVGEGHAQLASFQVHSGLKTQFLMCWCPSS